jgi:hypothetical protein
MSRIKLSVLGATLLAVLSISALAASSASAVFTLATTDECGAAGIPTWCWENTANKKLFNFSGTNSVAGKLEPETVNLLKGLLGEEIELKATGASLTGTLEQGTVLVNEAAISGVVIEFTGVTVTGNAAAAKKCAVKGEVVKTNSIAGSFGGAITKTKFKPTSGTTFASIEFINKGTETCPATIKGTKLVKGTQECENLEPGVDATTKLILCKETESSLTLGENTATFEAEFELTLGEGNTDPWSLDLA